MKLDEDPQRIAVGGWFRRPATIGGGASSAGGFITRYFAWLFPLAQRLLWASPG